MVLGYPGQVFPSAPAPLAKGAASASVTARAHAASLACSGAVVGTRATRDQKDSKMSKEYWLPSSSMRPLVILPSSPSRSSSPQSDGQRVEYIVYVSHSSPLSCTFCETPPVSWASRLPVLPGASASVLSRLRGRPSCPKRRPSRSRITTPASFPSLCDAPALQRFCPPLSPGRSSAVRSPASSHVPGLSLRLPPPATAATAASRP